MQIAYIHGFNSSHRSFAYIQKCLPEHDIVKIDYDSAQPLDKSILQVERQLPKTPFTLIGHSLGGIISIIIAAELIDHIDRVVVISSPLGGSRAASTLKWLPGHPKVLHDITPHAKKIELISQLKLQVPTLSIVSTGGSLATSNEPNDSVVSVSSQKALRFGRKVEVKANHFEILMHERTLKLLEDFIFGDTQ